ncbi:hypothetical protein KBTX_02525 [wastewater metagenome]|uniref:Diguanylate cyclase DosC n=2 Tax=unclassified sequences TaxID=12908 RepID=A0A5B8RH39_9ZZZZ|nr:hypothetical protein KBTEX_02525 [uncultured organism]
MESTDKDAPATRMAQSLGLDHGELERRKAFLEFTGRDAALLAELAVQLGGSIDDALDEFYDHLGRFPEMRDILDRDPEHLQGLKQRQRQHFRELATGPHDDAFVMRRLRVGRVHHRVGLAPAWYMGGYAKYLRAHLPSLWSAAAGDIPWFMQALDALHKIVFLDITLVLEAYFESDRAALESARRRLQRAQEAARLAVWEWDVDDGRVRWSETAASLFARGDAGMPDDRTSLLALLDPRDAADAEAALARALSDGQGLYVEFRVSARPGAWLSASGRVERDAAGRARRIVGVIQDISERREREAMLRAQEGKFRALMDNAADGMLIADADGRVIDWNQRFAELYGDEAPLTDRDLASFHPEPERQRVAAALAAAGQARGRLVSGSLLCAGHEPVPVEVSFTRIQWLNESLVLAVYRDLSERSRTEAELRKLGRALQQAHDAVMITDRRGRIEFVNTSFERETGYTQREVLGRTPRLLKSGRHDPEFYQRLWDTLSRGEVFRESFINRRKDGSLYHEAKLITPLRDGDGGITHFVSTGRDISRRMEMERRLQRLAYQDALTGLPNRTSLLERLEVALTDANERGTPLALLYLDLDQFKGINDTMGHAAGDSVLKQVARRLRRETRGADTVARMGGDEFAVIVTGANRDAVAHLGERLLRVISEPFLLEGRGIYPMGSIGIAVYPQDGTTVTSLLKHADTAMYRAKRRGGGQEFFAPQMNESVSSQFTLENELRRAVSKHEFRLAFQPQVSLVDGRIRGAEVLLRWRSPSLGEVSPARFMPVLEANGVIVQLGEWVIRMACRALRDWRAEGFDLPRIAINVAPVQLEADGFVEMVRRELAEAGLVPADLEIEVVETSLMSDFEAISASLRELRDLGVALALDDFGTGFSALSYLRRLPVTVVKVDREFVQKAPSEPADASLVEAIIAVGDRFELEVVGEGAETAEQVAFLRESGCQTVQGFYFARPMEAAAFREFLAGNGAGVSLEALGDGGR